MCGEMQKYKEDIYILISETKGFIIIKLMQHAIRNFFYEESIRNIKQNLKKNNLDSNEILSTMRLTNYKANKQITYFNKTRTCPKFTFIKNK